MHRIPPFGETCLDLRYWLLQAEINDVPLEIRRVSQMAIDLIINTSPPEWESDIYDLLEKYGTDSISFDKPNGGSVEMAKS
jgi:hypothetical protein